VAELSIALVEAGIGITALIPQRPSLEDLFFRFIEGESGGTATTPPAQTPAVMDVA
jgi:hypothetical protein